MGDSKRGDVSEADHGAELAEALTQLEKEGGGEDVSYRLTDSRRKRLEEIGFVWSARDGEKGTEIGRITRNSYDDQWDVMFEKLEEYKRNTGVRCGRLLIVLGGLLHVARFLARRVGYYSFACVWMIKSLLLMDCVCSRFI
jgi:hypothetical protein